MIGLLASPAAAQWRNLPEDTVPRAAGRQTDCRRRRHARPRASPILTGIYTPNYRYFQNLAADLGLENVPMTDEARKIHAARATGLLGYDEPDAHCLPQGVPKINMAPVPFKIVQTDTLVVLVYEAFNLWRQVFLDGREWADDLNPSWMGYSKGRWDGDTLVVETRGLNGKQWLDHGGLPASDKLMVIERFRRPTVGRLEIEIHDQRPDLLHEAVDGDHQRALTPDTELFEFVCNENEKSTPHMGPHIK